MIVMSAGLNAGMTALPNRDLEVSPSDTPNRDLDGIASRVMKIGPEESILRKKQVSPHKIGEYWLPLVRTLEFRATFLASCSTT